MTWNITQKEENMSDVIDGELIENEVAEPEATIPTPAATLDLGVKAVLTESDTRQIILDRIKDHEKAVVVDECILFECDLGVSSEGKAEVIERIAIRYKVIQSFVDEYNRIYGGSENG